MPRPRPRSRRLLPPPADSSPERPSSASCTAASAARRRSHAGARGRRLGRRGDSGGGVGELVQIVGSRSLLVDVHLLGGPGGAR